jgi:hypothetical protein
MNPWVISTKCEQAAGAMGGGGADGGGGGGGGSAARSDPLEGMSEGEIEKRTPDDISVIMDDDIVAKQLREAALAEEDPELRERLWDEYRNVRGRVTHYGQDFVTRYYCVSGQHRVLGQRGCRCRGDRACRGRIAGR